YHDGEGRLIATVSRYDPPSGKEFRPWDVKARRHKAPDPRPLYNQPGIRKSQDVLLVEGEKCAQALIEVGYCATTAMNGARAPVNKTDWSPLKDKRVLIWPDNDQPGRDYARNAAHAVVQAGARAVAIVSVPREKPPKWDAAEAVEGKENIPQFLSQVGKDIVKSAGLVITHWTAERYLGKAPELRFLIEDSFPLGVVAILAAMGDTGKGMLTLKLALEVACGNPESPAEVFGGKVLEQGTAVILSAEDDYAELHRRLERLDPDNRRATAGNRLIVVPLPDAGGPMAIVREHQDGAVLTPEYEKLRQQLMALENLKLVVFDPLSSFAQADVNA
ncbi:AAA family ATPase, partial [Kistimonas scapharcae]|uniref:AAA family ATPase n=1 Tax=Kistimonas scapharcae TaxID=1036133 RepID=UPI0031EDE7CF